MQIGFVGLGKMGLNMVTRLVRGGHQVVGLRSERRRGRARRRRPARKGVASLDALVEGADSAARGLGDGAVRRSHGVHRDRARPIRCRRTTPSSTAATPTSTTMCGGRRRWRPKRIALRRRRHERRHLGAAGRLLPDGRRRSRGLQSARADLPDAGAARTAICASATTAPATT